jgi:hypothetical protein
MLEGGNATLSSSAATIRMAIGGARTNVAGTPEREAPGRRNYITGSDPARWRTNVHLWEQIRFAGLPD